MDQTTATPAASKSPETKDKHDPKAKSTQSDLDIEKLLARVNQLEIETKQANERADGYLQQFEALKARGNQAVDLTTTTTKPTLKFTVTGPDPLGSMQFDVVDEGEAKRLYCAAKQIEPSAVALKVKCDEQDKRNHLIYDQYEKGGIVPERIPGVTSGFKPAKKTAATASV